MRTRKRIVNLLGELIPFKGVRKRFNNFFMYRDANWLRRFFVKPVKYDCIVSFGNACFCAYAMNIARLRTFSGPFDWIAGRENLNERVDLVLNGFKNFFEKSDLEYVGVRAEYKNSKTGYVFVHDFSRNGDFDAEYPIVLDKYKRRIKRLINKFETSNSVLILYSGAVDSSVAESAIKRLESAFGGHFDLLNVNFAPNVRSAKLYRVSEHVLKITVCAFDAWPSIQRKQALRQLITQMAPFRTK